MKLEVNLNWSKSLSKNYLLQAIELVEKSGVKRVWIGELEVFRDPLQLLKLVEENSSLKPALIVRPERALKLAEKYDVCVIPAGNGRKAVERVVFCLEKLSKRDVMEVYVGCSGRVLARKAYNAFKNLRIMPNYVKKEFIEWVLQGLEWEEVLPIGPSLILPSEKRDELLIASMLVMSSNESFAKAFGFEREFKALKSVDIISMIKNSKLERCVVNEDLLLENFSISGKLTEVAEKITSLPYEGFVLADPFFRDVESLKKLGKLKSCLKP